MASLYRKYPCPLRRLGSSVSRHQSRPWRQLWPWNISHPPFIKMWRVEALISLIFISSIDTGPDDYTIISTVLSWKIQKGPFLRGYRFCLGKRYSLAVNNNARIWARNSAGILYSEGRFLEGPFGYFLTQLSRLQPFCYGERMDFLSPNVSSKLKRSQNFSSSSCFSSNQNRN